MKKKTVGYVAIAGALSFGIIGGAVHTSVCGN